MAKTYDAIVVGSGACGGWAAMALTKAGMKVLMLEAGSRIDPVKDFKHVFLYQMEYRGQFKPGSPRRYSGANATTSIMLDNTEESVIRLRLAQCTTDAFAMPRWTHHALGASHGRMADYEFKAASRDGYGMDGRELRRYEALLRSCGRLHRSQCGDGGNASVSRRRVPAADAAKLRGIYFCRWSARLGLALHAAAAGPIDAHAEQPSAVPLLR